MVLHFTCECFKLLLYIGPCYSIQGRTDHVETRALTKGPVSVGGPMRCPWYLFHRLF
ncbi:unnamed protein product [Staurois parvus]|uniref:Uncharacterized protein n=1 Tax=Staurois parvus TaxID=386267 RepID=A0ABN9HSF8_9NEOB|nr:unnamed protein product [Staurois parvus]